MIYIQLFFAFLQIGAFSFGGGYAAMPLIQTQVIDTYHWLTIDEFTNLVTISQMTPGPIAINAATFVGQQVAGVFGSIAATLGCILPSLIIVITIAMLYVKYHDLPWLKVILKYLRPTVIAMILASGLTITISAIFDSGIVSMSTLDPIMLVLFVACFIVLLTKPKVNPILVMIASGFIYVAIMYLSPIVL